MAPRRPRPSWTVLALAVFAMTLRAAPAGGPVPRVSDGAGLFSAEALSEAGDIIRHIKEAYGRDVMVETYAQVPPELQAALERDGKEKFYDDWLNRRAKELKVRGVFVLVTRTPGRVQVGVDPSTRRRAFPDDDRDALREMLLVAFRMKQFDQGLLDGLRFARERIEANTTRDRGPSVPVAAASGGAL